MPTILSPNLEFINPKKHENKLIYKRNHSVDNINKFKSIGEAGSVPSTGAISALGLQSILASAVFSGYPGFSPASKTGPLK